MKKKSINKFGIVVIICSILLCIGIVTVSPAEAFADSVMPSFESFTDSDDYYYNGIKRNISEYELSMHKGNALNYILDENYGESGKYACTIKYAQDPATNIMRLIANGDDPSITNNEIFNCFYKRIKLLILIQYQSTLK